MAKGKQALRLTDKNNVGAPVIMNCSENVLFNKLKAAKMGSKTATHNKKPIHVLPPVVNSCSQTVLINKKKAARAQGVDKQTYGHNFPKGSDNILIG